VGVLWWSSYDLPLQVWGGGRGGLITVRCRALEICLLARGGKLGLRGGKLGLRGGKLGLKGKKDTIPYLYCISRLK
jgi:hypothetical protein